MIRRPAWTFRGSCGEVTLLRSADRSAEETEHALPAHLAAFELAALVLDPSAAPRLLEVAEHLDSIPPPPDLTELRTQLAARLEAPLLDGRLLLLRAKEKSYGRADLPAPAPAPAQEPRATPARELEEHWVEIALVDHRGRPVAGRRYAVTAPDGRVIEGYLDDQGRAYLRGIDPGEYQVTFPELDHRVWDRA